MLVIALAMAAVGIPSPAAAAAAAETTLVGGAASTAQFSAGQMFSLAEYAAVNGDPQAAAKIYDALAADPDRDVRAEARFRRAKQLMASKRTADAAVLLRAVVDEKPDATGVRLELASLLHELGEDESALRQLRAAQAFGLPPEVARMVDRYSEALRAARPFGATFEIALAPDTNINTSTRSDTLGTVLGDFDIAQDSKAKSGTGLSMYGQAYRRFALGSSEHSLLVRATANADLYRHSDYDDIALDFAAGPELQFGKNRLAIEAAGTQRWYGLKPYMRLARISASLIRPLGSLMQVQLIGSAGLAHYQLNDLQDGKTFAGSIKVERALSATTGIGINLSGARNGARESTYATTEWRLGLFGWRDVGRATLTAEAQFGRVQADDRLALLPDKRSDSYKALTIGATFRRLAFRGFAPVTRVIIERNRSTVEFYDYKRMRTEVGIVHAF